MEKFICSCFVYEAVEKTAKVSPAPLMPIPLFDAKWKKLEIDIYGPFKKAPAGRRFVITLEDYFRERPKVYFTLTVTASVVTSFLLEVFSREGYPDIHTQTWHTMGLSFCQMSSSNF